SKGTLDLLMDLDWVKLGPRKNTPGRPVTFATTQGFLDHFSLSSARDLPGLAEIRAAGLLEARGDLSSLMSGDTTPEEDAEDGDDDQGLLL
ncbi:MAG: SMC-Scp complex subunit ScpB, partial [Mangrovicoccus sp.]